MNNPRFLALAALGLVGMVTTAHAAVLHGDWWYAIDAQNDGSGGSVYEARGLAYKVDGDRLVFAFSTMLGLGGHAHGGVRNGLINNGDLFLNFTGTNLTSAAAFQQPGVFGIRFDGANDSLGNQGGTNTAIGLYSNLSVGTFATNNNGWASLQAYINAGFGRSQKAMGDLQSTALDVVPYLGNGQILANITQGTAIGGITPLSRAQLTGIDFAHFAADPSGNHVFGFSVDRNLLPTGDFKAHFFEECGNDGAAIMGNNPVPEPGTLMALAVGAVGLLRRRLRRNRA
ncbi:MAG TPA: PEP-CTERM sorting domain-containing protein [Fimbriimonadaceae bacterium]|nr:PEP-CTERM sorting domain-containing protein [Fimbriimonadaceae bacterium]